MSVVMTNTQTMLHQDNSSNSPRLCSSCNDGQKFTKSF